MIAVKSLQIAQWYQILLMFVLGAMTGLVYITLSPVWWLMFLGIAIMTAVFINNRSGVLIILAALFILQWLFGVFRIIPKEITWLPDVIILIMTAKFLYLQGNKKNWTGTPIDVFMLAILALGLVSAIYNNISVITFLFGFRKFFKYILMFYILRNIEHNEKFYRFFLFALFILILIQIPVTITQAIAYGTIGKDVADNVSGTLGWKATGAMALLMSFTISMMTGFYMQTKKALFLILAGLFIIPIILGSGQFGFVIAPLAVLICWTLAHRITVKKLIQLPILVAITVMLIIPAINYHDYRYKGNLAKFFSSPSEIYNLNIQTRKEGSFGRFQVMDVAHQILFENLPQLFVGFGPGNASESYFGEYSGKLEKEFRGLKIWGIQYTAIILEYGFVGLILFLLLFYRLWRMNRRLYFSSSDRFWKSISLGYNGLLFTYIAGALYNPVWYYDVLSFTFWFVTAGLVIQTDFENKKDLASLKKVPIEE